MKKYSPSIKANNMLKEKAVAEVNGILYRFEHGKYSADIEQRNISSVLEDLRLDVEMLEHSVGTGEEKVDVVAENIMRLAKELRKQSDAEAIHRIAEAADELDFYVNLWRDVLDGANISADDQNFAKAKVSFSRRRLNARLSDLAQVRETFQSNIRRLEKEIVGFEKDLSEFDAAILNEDNERKLNDLFRKVTALKTKTEALSARKSNYAACHDLLDIIYVNAAEIVNASDLAGEEIGKAKALLNINKLKKVLTEPDKALAILKRMQKDLNEICERTKRIDEKMAATTAGGLSVEGDALAYKEELLRKKRDKERMAENVSSINSGINVSVDGTKLKEEI